MFVLQHLAEERPPAPRRPEEHRRAAALFEDLRGEQPERRSKRRRVPERARVADIAEWIGREPEELMIALAAQGLRPRNGAGLRLGAGRVGRRPARPAYPGA